jgi:sugar lactone lactonase YvrE
MMPTPELILNDIAFGESPRWHQGRIWFCDWVDGDVVSVEREGSDRTTHAHTDGFPICIDWDLDGNLLIVDGSSRQLLRQLADTTQVIADLSTSANGPWNEIVAHPMGQMYVNGIGFDMMAGEPPTTGVIACVDPGGKARVVAGDLAFPNGMAINTRGDTLVVAESHAGRITSFRIQPDGDLSDRAVFAKIASSAPDGLCFTADGTIWYADVPNRHCQHLDPTGNVIDTIEFDRGCFSCAISPEGELFVTATVWDTDTFSTRRGVLYRAQTRT